MSISSVSMPNKNMNSAKAKVQLAEKESNSPKLSDHTRSHLETMGWEDGAPPQNTAQTIPHRDGSESANLPAMSKEANVPRGTISERLATLFEDYMKTAFKQSIKGGVADDKKPSDFDKKQLKAGIKVEMEHTNKPDMAKEIAMDHLEEFPEYYTALDKMEKQLEKKARCWKGYEPTPGKKPYSDDSCRKKEAFVSGFSKKADSFRESKPLYQPRPSSREGKKYMVYVNAPGGGKKLIHFGATGYKHNYSEEAKQNFRARHNCESAQKDSPKWWACNYLWNQKQDIGTKTYDKVAKILGL